MRLFLHQAVLPICFGLLFAVCCEGDDRGSAEYQKQVAKLSRETNPIARVKVLIKMSHLDINEVDHLVKKGDFREADRFLKRYAEDIKQAAQTLKDSKRNAQKNPAGFKDFEIALRKQLRRLEDLKLNYSFDQQEAINQALTVAESAKEQMFQAIFGAENAGGRKDQADRKGKGKQESD